MPRGWSRGKLRNLLKRRSILWKSYWTQQIWKTFAEALTDRLGKDTYIKVPTNEEGIKTMKVLKSRGNRVTATAIYMPQQAMLAASVGADYVAPYLTV